MSGVFSSSSPSSTASLTKDEESSKKSSLVRRMATRSTVTYQKFEGKQVNIVTDSSTESESEFEEGEKEDEKVNPNGVTQPSTDSDVELQECTDKIGGICIAEDEPPYLTGEPRFDTVLEENHFRKPLYFPRKISQLLPHSEVPLTLVHHGKKWDLIYNGNGPIPRFNGHTWKSFLKENGLQAGDALVFQLMKCSSTKVEFKVQILRCDIPPELLAYIREEEATNTINID